jgi:hypothetical protein
VLLRNTHHFSDGFLRTATMVENRVREHYWIAIVRQRDIFRIESNSRIIQIGQHDLFETARCQNVCIFLPSP